MGTWTCISSPLSKEERKQQKAAEGYRSLVLYFFALAIIIVCWDDKDEADLWSRLLSWSRLWRRFD